MKQLLEFIPLVAFYLAYKYQGIYIASMVFIVASIAFYGGLAIKQKGLEKFQWFALIATLFFCSITLLLKDESMLKLKSPIVNWLFALVFLTTHFVGQKTLVERMMSHVIELPKKAWSQLNMSWVMFFLILGTANYYIAFNYHDIWVDFKLFGGLGLTFFFVLFQGFFLAKYLKPHISNQTNQITKEK